ncbi:MAG: DNA-3-methyladenine glycosylase 2 family protein [Eubacterium sp.]|nr:DNA-3-methyladenine glycosylase 2 family protein [Eubacterium sp.]
MSEKDRTILKYDLSDERVQYLIRTDELLGKLIRYIGTSELVIERDGFKCLVKYIIGQQISDKARETIWMRLCTTLNSVTSDVMLGISNHEIRRLGISSRKVECIKTLAESVIKKKIDFEKFVVLSNEEIITKLTALKGIGQWTAEMYLIFSLGREDVLSKGDRTIRHAIQWLYDLKELPSPKILVEYFVSWMEYATIVSSYLWKSMFLGLTQKPFCEVVLV